jgi:hypothetical protein
MGCRQSTPVQKKGPFTVGQTERMVSRAARVNNANNPNKHTASLLLGSPIGDPKKEHPKLDADGHLVKEEVVRRTSSAIRNKHTVLGTPDNPIQVEVRLFVIIPVV